MEESTNSIREVISLSEPAKKMLYALMGFFGLLGATMAKYSIDLSSVAAQQTINQRQIEENTKNLNSFALTVSRLAASIEADRLIDQERNQTAQRERRELREALQQLVVKNL